VEIGTSTDVGGNNVGNVLNDLVAANPAGLGLGVHGGDAAPSEEGAKGLVVARILVCTLVVTSSLRSLARILIFIKARSLRSLTS